MSPTIRSIGRQLNGGESVANVSGYLGCSRAWTYRVAADMDWPTNPRVTPESPREAQIVAAARVLTTAELSEAFSMAPIYVKEVLKRVDVRTKLEYS